ncbi:MAG: glycosyltransferase [Bacteroidales bacterium]|nr:glycosyltransferase [Bacteroidales bacterium]
MVGIVILNYNNALLTINCLESIVKYNTYPIHIVIVDNASTDDSIRILQDYQREHNGLYDLLLSDCNGGYAQGNNLGLRFLDSIDDVTEVMVLNNDILFTEDIIPVLKTFIENHPEAALVSPLLRKRDGVTIDNSCARKDCKMAEIIWSFFLYFTDFFGIISKYRTISKIPIDVREEAIRIELPSGSCMMITKDIFRSIDYFDPNTFLYYEENILYQKILSIGRINYLIPSVSCIHLGGETTNKVSHPASYMKKSKASAYYYAKNYRMKNIFTRLLLELSYRCFLAEVTFVKAIKNR